MDRRIFMGGGAAVATSVVLAQPAQAYNYSHSYNIQHWMAASYWPHKRGEDVWKIVKPALRGLFPISGMVNNPRVGQRLILQGNNPVSVVTVGSRHFTLKSLPGHQEGAGNYISFTFTANKLLVNAWGPTANKSKAILPFVLWLTFSQKVMHFLAPGAGYGYGTDPSGNSQGGVSLPTS